MSVTDAERRWFDRARERLARSGLDDLTVESTEVALGKAELFLEGAKVEDRKGAEAMAALSVAFATSASGSRRMVEEVVECHARMCKEMGEKAVKDTLGLRGFVEEGKRSLLGAPMALAVVVSVVILKFGDRVLGWVF